MNEAAYLLIGEIILAVLVAFQVRALINNLRRPVPEEDRENRALSIRIITYALCGMVQKHGDSSGVAEAASTQERRANFRCTSRELSPYSQAQNEPCPLCTGICLLVWNAAIAISPQHLLLPQRICAAISAHYAVLCGYYAIYHWRNDTRKPLLGWEFFLTSIIVVIIILLDCGLGDAQPVFGSPIAFKRTWLYYVEAALSFGGLLFLELLIFRIYLKSWQRNARWWKNEWFQETDKSPRERDEQFDEICDQARIVSGTLAFAIHIVALLMVEGDLLYEQAIAHDASLLLEDGVIVSAIYQIGVFLWPVLMTVGFAPEPILRRVLQPWQARATGRLRQWQRDVAWLWDCYRLALPGMPPAEPGALRSAIETARCRLLGQPVPSITPEDEAQVLIGRIRVRQPSRGQRLPVPARSRVRKRACGARLEPAVARSMAPNRWSLALKMVGECARAPRNLGLHVQDRTNVDTVKHYVAVAKNLRSLLDERDRDHLTL